MTVHLEMISLPPHPSLQSPPATASEINSAIEDVQLIRLGKQDIASIFRLELKTSLLAKVAAVPRLRSAAVKIAFVLEPLLIVEAVVVILLLLSLSSHQVSLSENLYGTAGGTNRIRG